MMPGSIIVAAAIMLAPAASRANNLPDVSPFLYSDSGGTQTFHSQLGTISGVGGLASALFAPNAVIRVAANPGSRFDASLNYSFRLDGPADTIVPLIAYASMALTKDAGFGRVYAGLNIHDGFAYVASKGFELGNDDGAATVGFSGGIAFEGHSGAVGEFNLYASANSYSLTGSAFVDPYLIIDPAFALVDPDYASKYRLSFSVGAGNAAPGIVPEPDSWVMLITGFGLVGAAARRRHRSQPRAATRVPHVRREIATRRRPTALFL